MFNILTTIQTISITKVDPVSNQRVGDLSVTCKKIRVNSYLAPNTQHLLNLQMTYLNPWFYFSMYFLNNMAFKKYVHYTTRPRLEFLLRDRIWNLRGDLPCVWHTKYVHIAFPVLLYSMFDILVIRSLLVFFEIVAKLRNACLLFELVAI